VTRRGDTAAPDRDSPASQNGESMLHAVPEIRMRTLTHAPPRPERDFVLYWMTAFRRLRSNFSLDRAIAHAQAFEKPLVVLEALRCDYEWASDRLHTFVLQGMAEHVRAAAGAPLLYYPYVETAPGEGRGLLGALAARAAIVVTDDYPAFFIPRMLAAAAPRLDVRLEAVDSNGLLPLRAADRTFTTAFSFRAFLQRSLRPHLDAFPQPDPLKGLRLRAPGSLPADLTRAWPAASAAILGASPDALRPLPLDHDVAPVSTKGGRSAATTTLRRFLRERLVRYPDERGEPEADASSGLSPYLHFGHLSVQEVFAALMTQEGWTSRLLGQGGGKREGWWGASRAAEAFLDELVTWREIGFNMCARHDDYDGYDTLPAWARATLAAHARDKRPSVYTRDRFAAADTHDPLWNAAQTELVREGRLHNYLRMLWGKKILEWSRTPQDALQTMVSLNNTYALDGRDPNSYSGIFWCLGRYDRPWGPERPIFGTVRYMSSENTARKVRVKAYMKKYLKSQCRR
jgi:deoxyribodipyrimidine photo-lyase